MTDTFGDSLPGLDLGAIDSFYAQPPEAARDVEVGLDDDRVLVRTPTARRCFNALHIANLAKALTKLPAPGETWHIICKGNWPAWSLVPRMMELHPHRMDWLGIATLGYSKDNTDELCQMLDAGQIGAVDVIYSCYFKSNETALVGYFEHQLRRRGQRAKAIRNHAKVIAAQFADGTGITVESSANLRSNRNIEQFTITNDATLAAFHRDWLNTVLQEKPPCADVSPSPAR